ncbi:MAG: TlpA family protein disulfide reductase, partial [Saprospiraceae bacterium]|nr:TlpA family protein disulfide reductase [Saprospiraceae bacterium]
MKPLKFLVFVFSFLTVSHVQGQELRQFSTFDDLRSSLFLKNDTTYVINFWASWCKPCVNELPFFENFNTSNQGQKIKVILVSLDFKKQIESHLKPFLKKRNLTSEVVLLNDKSYDQWLSKVDKGWAGSIPATLLIHGNR